MTPTAPLPAEAGPVATSDLDRMLHARVGHITHGLGGAVHGPLDPLLHAAGVSTPGASPAIAPAAADRVRVHGDAPGMCVLS